MAHYQGILAYDGTDFLGFQRQGRERTVQFIVETALRKLGWQERTILSAGRTDSGVHASGQVISFELDWSHSTEKLKMALNANLPRDTALLSIEEADTDFHPRFSAVSRTYQYRIYCAQERNPLLEKFTWRVWPTPDPVHLQRASSLLPGRYDCSAFGAPLKKGGGTVRTILSSGWRTTETGLEFEVTANAFLYHMVRRIVFLQCQVGEGKLALEELALAVSEQKKLKPGLAPPHGLTLTKVNYDKTAAVQEAEQVSGLESY